MPPYTSVLTSESATVEAACPAGKKLIGGGGLIIGGDSMIGTSSRAVLKASRLLSHPHLAGQREAWEVQSSGGSYYSLHPYAICAVVAG